MGPDAHMALGILIGAALHRADVRRVSSVFYDGNELVVEVEFADPALDNLAVSFTEKQVREKNLTDLSDWSERLLNRQLGLDDDDDEDEDEQDEDEYEVVGK